MNGGTQIRQLDPHFGQRYFERRTRRRRPQLFQDALDEVVMFATAAAIKIGYVHSAVPHGPLTMLRFLFVCHAIRSSGHTIQVMLPYFNYILILRYRASTDRADLDFGSRGLLLAEFKTAGETLLKSAASNARLMKEEGDEFASTDCGGLGLC